MGLQGWFGRCTQIHGKRGLKLHSDAPIQADSSDVQKAVQSLSAGEPDAIIMITAGAPTVTFIKAYRKVSRAARFYTTSVMGSQSTIQALGPDGVGVVVTWWYRFPGARARRSPGNTGMLKKAGMQESVSFIGLETSSTPGYWWKDCAAPAKT